MKSDRIIVNNEMGHVEEVVMPRETKRSHGKSQDLSQNLNQASR
jgi:hypothetical protein